MKVLLADAHLQVRSALTLLLEQDSSIRIAEVDNSNDLLARVPEFCPDLVLMDWDLPGNSNVLLSELRAQCPHLFVVVLSARSDVRQASLIAGADYFVSKGDPPEQLLAAINSFQKKNTESNCRTIVCSIFRLFRLSLLFWFLQEINSPLNFCITGNGKSVVRLNTFSLYQLPVWCQPAPDSQVNIGAIFKRNIQIIAAFTKGFYSGDGRPLVILQCSGKDFAAAGAELVYQDSHGQVCEDTVRMGGFGGTIALVIHKCNDYAILYEMTGYLYNRLDQPTRIAA